MSTSYRHLLHLKGNTTPTPTQVVLTSIQIRSLPIITKQLLIMLSFLINYAVILIPLQLFHMFHKLLTITYLC